ncbi:hypothetical protein TNCV_687321 [Trichonephila clavipes]|nr:hypothetical protein TNCV_687321 [Trichonephila clavipes]
MQKSWSALLWHCKEMDQRTPTKRISTIPPRCLAILYRDAGCHWEMEREAFLHPISRLLLSPCVGGPA